MAGSASAIKRAEQNAPVRPQPTHPRLGMRQDSMAYTTAETKRGTFRVDPELLPFDWYAEKGQVTLTY
jgi:hypothetical protein